MTTLLALAVEGDTLVLAMMGVPKQEEKKPDEASKIGHLADNTTAVLAILKQFEES